MRMFLATFLLIMVTKTYSQEIKIFHYNIKELDSLKINKGSKNKQLTHVKQILKQHSFDIIDFNEVQYDMPNVPSSDYQSKGKNLQKLRTLFGLNSFKYESFNIANTGLHAKTKADGTYYLKPNSPQARALADQVNFGTVPGQYSSGALFKYKKLNEKIINDLKWKDFNSKIDLSLYKTADGNPLPEDMPLFDKNFSDITLDINGKELHLVLLHTVPAFHFGNKYSVNYLRNADQLRFLEWYLTGSTDFKVSLKKIKPLSTNAYFVATGDWNTSLSNLSNPGSKVLKNLFAKTQLWIKEDQLSFSNESPGFGENPLRLMLDYIAYSKNIEIIDGKIIHPDFTKKELGCGLEKIPAAPINWVLKSYKKNNKECYVFVHRSYSSFKEASDHYPIWGHFKLK